MFLVKFQDKKDLGSSLGTLGGTLVYLQCLDSLVVEILQIRPEMLNVEIDFSDVRTKPLALCDGSAWLEQIYNKMLYESKIAEKKEVKENAETFQEVSEPKEN